MKKKIMIIVIFNCIIQSYAISSEDLQKKSFLRTTCCVLLGTANAPDDIQSCFTNAADNFDISQDKRLPIKLINKCPVLNSFSSFTWFGTWINRDYWQKMSNLEQEWSAYHEIAHQKLNHPKKQIITAASALFSSAVFSYYFKFQLLSAIAITGSLLAFVSSSYAHICERQADILAAQTLYSKDKGDIVAEHIKSLSFEPNEWSMWFNSPADQIKYLQAIKDVSITNAIIT